MPRPGESKLWPADQMQPAIPLLLARINSEDPVVYHTCLYILSIFASDEEMSDSD